MHLDLEKIPPTVLSRIRKALDDEVDCCAGLKLDWLSIFETEKPGPSLSLISEHSIAVLFLQLGRLRNPLLSNHVKKISERLLLVLSTDPIQVDAAAQRRLLAARKKRIEKQLLTLQNELVSIEAILNRDQFILPLSAPSSSRAGQTTQ